MSRYLGLTSFLVCILLFSCQKESSFELGKQSKGSLQSANGNCLSKTVNGVYEAGKVLADTDYIDVTVDVTKTGAYSVYTDTVNGYYFKGTGKFTTVGAATVRMKAFGTPLAAGTNTFSVFYDSSFCSVDVTVVGSGGSSGGTTSPDHFILTDNSWWSYGTPISGDTLKRSIISGNFTIAGASYKGMKELDPAGQIVDDTLFFRKSGNNYYEYNYIDYYTSFYFDNTIVDSILFLKEGLNTNDTWSSAVYTGAENGASRKVRYDFTCTNSNATVTLNSKTYTNVYQVTLKVMVDKGSGFVTDVTWTNYYAKGIGWIYEKVDDGSGPFELPIRNYQVF